MPDRQPMPELQMAMVVARHIWRGTSIVEGAFWWMEEVRRMHPEQFKDEQK